MGPRNKSEDDGRWVGNARGKPSHFVVTAFALRGSFDEPLPCG